MRSALLLSLLLPLLAQANPVAPTNPGEGNTCPPVPAPPLPACSHNGVDISDNDAAIVEAIKAQQFCFQAVTFAEKCGSNQEADIKYVIAATAKCEARLATLRPSQTDLNNLSNLKVAYNRKWYNREGAHYKSINAYCKLRALSWTLNLLDERE